MQGWVKLYRELLDKPIWQLSTPGQRSVLITILMLASHSKKNWEWNGKPFAIVPGQFVTSLPSLAKKAGRGTTVQIVRGALARFVKYDFITDQSTGSGRLITVVNWGHYQAEKEKSTDQSTDRQQSNNRPTTPIKNVKNDKTNNSEVDFAKLIEFFNEQTGHKYKNVESNRKIIKARLNEGFTKSDIALVIQFKSREWKSNPEMNKYLRPNTLFAPSHFNDYLEEARSQQQPSRQETSSGRRELPTAEEIEASEKQHMAELEARYKKQQAKEESE